MAWISFGALPCRKTNLMTARVSLLLKSRASVICFRACFRPGRAEDLSAPRYNHGLLQSTLLVAPYSCANSIQLCKLHALLPTPCTCANSMHLCQLHALVSTFFPFPKEFLELFIADINLLTPNVNYSGRTAPLTSKVAFYIFIQEI